MQHFLILFPSVQFLSYPIVKSYQTLKPRGKPSESILLNCDLFLSIFDSFCSLPQRSVVSFSRWKCKRHSTSITNLVLLVWCNPKEAPLSLHCMLPGVRISRVYMLCHCQSSILDLFCGHIKDRKLSIVSGVCNWMFVSLFFAGIRCDEGWITKFQFGQWQAAVKYSNWLM